MSLSVMVLKLVRERAFIIGIELVNYLRKVCANQLKLLILCLSFPVNDSFEPKTRKTNKVLKKSIATPVSFFFLLQ